MIQLYVYIYMRKHNQQQYFRKIYLSHFILERVAKGLCVRGELETGTDCNILTPSSSVL